MEQRSISWIYKNEMVKLEVKEDERFESLENFKEGIEEAFIELIGDLNEFNKEIND